MPLGAPTLLPDGSSGEGVGHVGTEQREKFGISVIPGDGIGNEVVPEGLRVLEAVGKKYGFDYGFEHYDWNCERYAKTGAMMPEDGLGQNLGVRFDFPWCRRLPGCAGSHLALGSADPDPPRVPAIRQPAPGALVARHHPAGARL